MFGPDHYVPILKCKQGELRALGQLASKQKLTPLLEVDEIPRDLDDGSPQRDIERHAEIAIDGITSGWGTANVFFLDVANVAQHTAANGVDGASYFLSEASTAGLIFIPVVGVNRLSPELAACFGYTANGLCIRIARGDVFNVQFQNQLNRLVAASNVPVDRIDLVVDLGSLVDVDLAQVTPQAIFVLNQIPNVATWRTLSIVGSAFPASMGVLHSNSHTTLPRTEWQNWLALRAGTCARIPTFGDYGVQHPIVMEGFDPRYMAQSAAIRYTHRDTWLLVKGQSTKLLPGGVQYQSLASILTRRPEFYGSQHCNGCSDIAACAVSSAGNASASAWRRIGTTHHLELVLQQVAAVASGRPVP